MRPLATGSLMLGKTIGIVPFSRLSAKIAGAGFVMMMPHTEQLHVVERYRIIEGGKAIEAVAHVEDPGAFTTPWTAYQRYRQVEQGPLGEEVCAENNADFFGYKVQPIPTAATPDF